MKKITDILLKYIQHTIILLLLLGIVGTNNVVYAISETTYSDISKQQKNKEDDRKFELNLFWEDYSDEYLSTYILEALDKNPTLKIANDRLRQSQALLGTINAQRLPHIGVAPSVYPYRSLSGKTYSSHNDITMPLFFNWEIDIFGKLSDKVQSGRYDVKIAKEDVNIKKLSLTSEICAMYFNIILTDDLIENEEEILKNLDEVLKLKKQLYEGGIIKYDDLYITEYEKINTQNELNSLYKQRDILSHAFSFLRAAAPQEDINHRTMEEMTLPFLPDTEINSDLIFNRPDVIQAEYAIKKAAFDVKVAKKMFLPSFNLNEIVGFESFRASRLFNWESIVYQFGAGLLLDLYTGGYKKHFLKYNKELALEKLHKYDYTILDAVRETEDCLSSYKTDYKAYVDFKDVMENSQHYYNVAHTRYLTGIGNRIDELDARRQYLINENAMNKAKAASLIDTVSLYKALGSRIHE